MRSLALLVLLTGCSTSNFPPELPLEARLTTCETADDCVRIELACCDDCNGGMAVAVNRQSADEVRESLSQGNCEGTACTLRACSVPVVSCDAGVCSWEYGPEFR